MQTSDSEVRLGPDRGVAGRWTGVGLLAAVLALWVALDARDSVLAWAFVALCLVVTSYVGIQLVRPDRFVLQLDPGGVEVRLPWQRARVPWSRVHVARVVNVAGEPVLELHVWDLDDPAQSTPRATGILLPVGADLDALHAGLEHHLGVADDAVTGPAGAAAGGA